MIREIGGSVGEKVFGTIGKAISRSQEKRPLPVDLLESDDDFLAIFDAPGVASSEVTVTFDDGTIFVRMDRFREFKDGFEMVFPGRGLALDGRVSLPDNASVDPDGATATLKENGTLHVSVPKKPIEDEAAGGDEAAAAVEEADDIAAVEEADTNETAGGNAGSSGNTSGDGE